MQGQCRCTPEQKSTYSELGGADATPPPVALNGVATPLPQFIPQF